MRIKKIPIEFREEEVSKRIVFLPEGIFLERSPKKGETTRIPLSNLTVENVQVCEEPGPYSNGRFLKVLLKKNSYKKEIAGNPEEIASQVTHIHRDKLAQALAFYLYYTKDVEIVPRSDGFYLVEGKIKFFGKVKNSRSNLENEIEFLEKLVFSYPSPEKFALILTFMISAILTPVRKALHIENPGLLIRGEKATGKTTFAETILFGLLGQTVESGQSIATPARFAKLANSNILVVVDEAEKFFKSAKRDASVIDVFKAVHTTNSIVRRILTKDRNTVTEYARSNFIYIMNPLTLSIDEAMKRRLMSLVFTKEDRLKEKKPVPRRKLPSVFIRLIKTIEQNSEEIVRCIKNETSHKDFLDTGLLILHQAGLDNIARQAEDVLADISFEEDDIFDEDAEATAEVRRRIANIVRGSKDLLEAEKKLKQHSFEGIYLKDDNLYITATFIAGNKIKIKLKQLAERLGAEYTFLWKDGKSIRAVRVSLQEVFPK